MVKAKRRVRRSSKPAPSAVDGKQMLKMSEAVKLGGVSIDTLYRRNREGELQIYKIGNLNMVDRVEFMTFLKKHPIRAEK
jgi:hypothetical protein